MGDLVQLHQRRHLGGVEGDQAAFAVALGFHAADDAGASAVGDDGDAALDAEGDHGHHFLVAVRVDDRVGRVRQLAAPDADHVVVALPQRVERALVGVGLHACRIGAGAEPAITSSPSVTSGRVIVSSGTAGVCGSSPTPSASETNAHTSRSRPRRSKVRSDRPQPLNRSSSRRVRMAWRDCNARPIRARLARPIRAGVGRLDSVTLRPRVCAGGSAISGLRCCSVLLIGSSSTPAMSGPKSRGDREKVIST